MSHVLIVNDILRARYFTSAGDVQSGINVVGYRVSNVVAPGVTDQDVADHLSGLAAVKYKAYLSQEAKFEGVSVQVCRPVVFPTVTSTQGSGVGARATELLPFQATMLFSLRTPQAGPKGRGRTFLPFWSEGDNSATGEVEGAASTLGENVIDVIIAPHTINVGAFALTIMPVIISNAKGVAANFDITHTQARLQWATQRRRSRINKPDTLGPR